MRKKISFLAIALFLICIALLSPKQTVYARLNSIRQTTFATKSATIEWDTPDIPVADSVNWYKITWDVDGITYEKTINAKTSDLKYTITKLTPSSKYKITITYEFIAANGSQQIQTYDSIIISTAPAAAAIKTKDLQYYGSTLKGKLKIGSGLYQYAFLDDPEKDLSRFDTFDATDSGYTHDGSKSSYITLKGLIVGQRNGVQRIVARPYKPGGIDANGKPLPDVYGNWVTKWIVPDPYVEVYYRPKKKDYWVTIEPLKNALSYEVYMGIYTGQDKDNHPTGKKFIKVGTVRAYSKKNSTLSIKKYKNRKFTNKNNRFVVKVITISRYGRSNGKTIDYCHNYS